MGDSDRHFNHFRISTSNLVTHMTKLVIAPTNAVIATITAVIAAMMLGMSGGGFAIGRTSPR
jgi:hypothetical protein